jgi:hypothetical protein
MTDAHLDQEKQKAAEVLIADAISQRDRLQAELDRAQAVVDFLTATYKAGPSTNGKVHAGVAATVAQSGDEVDAGDDGGYGAIRKAVFRVMLDTHRKMTIGEITQRFVALGIQTDAKAPVRSVRNAVRGLTRSGKVKKVGNAHYKALEPMTGVT